MADSFDLPVEFNGEEKLYPTTILRYGFTHKLQVTVNNIIVTFEPDEEKNYRAIVDNDNAGALNKHLLEQISNTLHFLLGD